jgi:hypothetical protein
MLSAYASMIIKNPFRIFHRLYLQSIVVEQPVDILPTGEIDLCDGCPNKTLWKDRLVSACVLEEYLQHGGPVYAVSKSSPVEGEMK